MKSKPIAPIPPAYLTAYANLLRKAAKYHRLWRTPDHRGNYNAVNYRSLQAVLSTIAKRQEVLIVKLSGRPKL